MNTSRIAWTDYTWSPVTGCSKISSGCKNCYAEAYHRRFMGGDFSVKVHYERMDEPVNALRRFKSKHGRRPRVFVCPMADLFHDDVPDECIEQVWWTMALCTHIDFIVLTKRPIRMQEFLSSESFVDSFTDAVTALSDEYPLPNVWIGVSAEDQFGANRRVPILLKTPAAIRWVSIEPMIGPVDMEYAAFNGADSSPSIENLHWVVCGGESGKSARPMSHDWVRSLRDQCHQAKVPFFFKQWGPEGGLLRYGLPALDSVVHNAFPEAQREKR